MILAAEAPAKINRELRVGARRADGYHEIRSLLVSIDFGDRLEVETSETLEFSCVGSEAPRDETNLVVRAARALAQKLAVAPRARIRLEKRVPAGAGLGGGSADAAVALLLLQRLWEASLPERELASIAASLGSDVPFFLLGGQAEATGRGDILHSREELPEAELTLFVPPFPISTREVYEVYARQTAGKAVLPPTLEIEESGGFFGPNDLASAVLETQPEMEAYVRSAGRAASSFTITGSGSALVLMGVSAEGEGEIAHRHPEAMLLRTKTLSREEYRRRTSG